MLTKSVKRKNFSRGPPDRRRVLIIDDHPLMRRGLTALINNEPDLIVCAEAATPQAGIEALASSRPDLVITDLSMGRGDGAGLYLIREIRSGFEGLPVLVLTMHTAPHYPESAFGAGANGYITKQELGETLLVAIRSVLNGGKYLSPRMSAGPDPE